MISMVKNLIVIPHISQIGNLSTNEVYLHHTAHIILTNTIRNRLES
jgi:hypothetical protein